MTGTACGHYKRYSAIVPASVYRSWSKTDIFEALYSAMTLIKGTEATHKDVEDFIQEDLAARRAQK